MAQNNRELAKKSLDLKWAPNRFVDKQDKELNAIQSQMDLLLEGAGDVESAFLKKAPHERDAYDLAFAKLNPESARKADKYWKLAQKKLKVENEKVNLEAARDLMNQVYSEQLNNINSGYDALNEASGIRNNITLNAAQSATGGLGSNAVANSALRAQASNQIAKEGLDIEAQRQRDLAQATAAQMQTPAILSQIGAANTNIDLARENARSQASARGYSSGRSRRRWLSGGSWLPDTQNNPGPQKLELTPDQKTKLEELAKKQGYEFGLNASGDYYLADKNWPKVLTEMDVDDILNQNTIGSDKLPVKEEPWYESKAAKQIGKAVWEAYWTVYMPALTAPYYGYKLIKGYLDKKNKKEAPVKTNTRKWNPNADVSNVVWPRIGPNIPWIKVL